MIALSRPSILDRSFTRLFVAALACASAQAALLTWDTLPTLPELPIPAIDGGSGDWDLTTTNWTADFGETRVPWTNLPVPNDANFSGVAGGLVTLKTPINVGNVTFEASGYALAGSPLNFTSATPTITNSGVVATFSNVLAGNNGLTVTGFGTPVTYFDAANTYAGVTNVEAGFLVLRHANALGSAAQGTVVLPGATVQLENIGAGDVHIANEAITISGIGMLGGRGALSTWQGNNSWGGSVTLAGDSSIWTRTGTLTINGVISGDFGLTKTGDTPPPTPSNPVLGGELRFGGSQSNTYTGITTIAQGTLLLAKTGGAKAIVGPVMVGGGTNHQVNLRMEANEQFGPGVVLTFPNVSGQWGRFDLQGTTQTLGGIQTTTAEGILGGGVIQNEKVNAGGTTGPATLRLDTAANFSYTGYLRDRDGGAGTWLTNLVKTGPGTQTLAGAQIAYTGTTTISQGTLRLLQTTGFNSRTTIASGATLELAGIADVQNSNTGAILDLAGTINRTTSAGWLVWVSKINTTSATATINLRNDGDDIVNGKGWLFMDGGIGTVGAGSALTINHTKSDGVTPNDKLSTVLRNNANASTYSGSITVNNGSLVSGGNGASIANAIGFSNADITLNNATLQFGPNIFATTQNGINQLKSVSGTGTFAAGGSTVQLGTNNGSGSFAGNITGTGTINKMGTGTQTFSGPSTFTGALIVTAGTLNFGGPTSFNGLTVNGGALAFSGANSGTGATTVNAGTLTLDYGTQDNSKLSDTGALTLGGATINLIGGSHGETVASTLLTTGTISTINRTSGTAVLNLNTITAQPGAVLNFSASGIATTDTLNSPSGILGPWALVGNDWAANSTNADNGLIVAYTGYSQVNRLGGAIPSNANANLKVVDGGAGGNITLSGAGTTNASTLLQGATGGTATVDIGTGKTLRLGAAGLIFLPSGNSGLAINGGVLTAGGADDAPGGIEVKNNSATNGVAVGSQITDNGVGVVSFIKSGPGAVTLTGVNTYTGGTVAATGMLAFNPGSLGTVGTITGAGGTLRWNGVNTEDISPRLALLNGTTTGVDTNGNNLVFGTGIAASTGGLTKLGAGSLTLQAANNHSGVTAVQGGTLVLNNVNALQNSTLDVGAAGPASVVLGVAGANTYTLGGLQGANNLNLGGNSLNVGNNTAAGNYSGVISGNGNLTKIGPGSLTLSGAASNTYVGATTMASNGQWIFSKTNGAIAVTGDMIMAAPGSRGIVSTTQDNQFAPGSVLRFTTGGDTRLELKGTTQTFGGIDNSTAPVPRTHIVQHSEFGTPTAVDATSATILDVTGANSFTFDGFFRDFTGGTMSLVKKGTGTQQLTGTNITYTGPTTLEAGDLIVMNAAGFNSSTTVSAGARLIFNGTANVTGTGVPVYTMLDGAVMENRNPKNWQVTAGSMVVNANATINHRADIATAANVGLFVDGGLKGTGTLTINTLNPGSGVNFRNNNSSFSGTIIVNGIPSTVPFAGSGLGVGGNTIGFTNADIVVNGTVELLNQGIGSNNTAPGDFWMGALSGPGVMIGNFTAGGETRVRLGNNNHDGTFTGTLADGNGNRVVLTKNGTGTQVLAGTNPISGTTTIAAGTLQLGNGGTTGSIGGGLIVNNSALVINRSNDYVMNNVISGTGSLTKNGAGVLQLTKNSTYAGPTTIQSGTMRLGIDSTPTTLPTSSAIWLDATDGKSINTSVDGVTRWTNKGTMGADGDATATPGQEPSFLVSDPGMNNQPVIHFSTTAAGGEPFDRLTNLTNFAPNTALTVMYAGRLTGGANYRMVGGLNNNWLLGTWGGNSESAFFNTPDFLANGTPADQLTRIYTGTISNGNGVFYSNGEQKGSRAGSQGPNGLVLGGAFPPNGNEYSNANIGELLIFTSVLTTEERFAMENYLSRKWQGGGANVLPTTTAVGLVAPGTTLDINSIVQTVGSITGVAGSSILLGNGGSLTTGGDGTSTTFAGSLSGAGTVTKVGAGTWTVSGANSNTGDVYVNAGTLALTGSLTGSAVHVQTGGTLSGNGNIGGPVDIADGSFLSPGAPLGTLTTRALDLEGAVTDIGTHSLIFAVGATGDKVVLSNNSVLTLGVGVLEFDDFSFSAVAGLTNGTYTLFDSSVAIDGSLGTNLTGVIGTSFMGTLSTNGQDILLTVVPEPGTAVLLLAGLGMLARRRRATTL